MGAPPQAVGGRGEMPSGDAPRGETIMKLLLRRDIPKLGLAGDVVDVSQGYARNFLLPQRLAVEPTKANMRQIEEDKKRAEAERRARRAALETAASKLANVEVMIHAAANPEGSLYGSVGPREISAALREEGHDVEPSHVELHETLRKIGNWDVPVVFSDDLRVTVKVWIVQEKRAGDLEAVAEERAEEAGTEAGDGDEADGQLD
jgi:large subunit ribosomal protein L9